MDILDVGNNVSNT